MSFVSNEMNIKFFRVFIFLCIVVVFSTLHSQINFQLKFDTVRVPSWPGIHSFVYGTVGDTIIVIGGRRDGLHEKESGFEYKRANDSVYIISLKDFYCKAYPLAFIPDTILSNAMRASNALFTQKEDQLYVMGGYGESITKSYTTYPIFYVIDLPKFKVELESSSTKYSIISKVDSNFAIAGGQMLFLDDRLAVVGGHYFKGKYIDKSNQFIQKYTNKASFYEVSQSGNQLQCNKVNEIIDEFNFHRRDYNLAYDIQVDGSIELMIYSGVFLENEARPFFNIASLNQQGYKDVENFEQLFANYHCSKLGMYSAKNKEMKYFFFGGMSEYYRDSTGDIGRDPFVPFVNHVSCILRDSLNTYDELLLKDTLPGFFGSTAEFIANSDLDFIKSNIINADLLRGDSIYLGFIFGGIWNPIGERNAWSRDRAKETLSNPFFIKSYLLKTNISSNLSKFSSRKPTVKLVLSPSQNKYILTLKPEEVSHLSYYIVDLQGHIIESKTFSTIQNEMEISLRNLIKGQYRLILSLNKSFIQNELIQIY